jgi:acetylornithine deacetylase
MASEYETSIIRVVDESREEIVEYLQKLISFNSITGNEGEIQEFIADTLIQSGLEVDKFEPDIETLRSYNGFLEPELPFDDRPNIVGVWKGSGGGKSLLLNGHVDTVPTEPLEQWNQHPLSGAIVEGKVIGRGASDMKAGIAAMTMAVVLLKRAGVQLKGDLILEYVVDEERTGLGTLACVGRGYQADAGICCETSDLEIMAACIGRMWFTIKVRGKPTGISARWEGVSSIDKAIKLVQAVDDLEKIRFMELHHPLYPDNRGALPCAVTMFNAGTFPSITPEFTVLRGSMGLMPYEDPQEVKQQLTEQIERISKTDPWLRNHMPEVSIEGGYVAAGAEIPIDHPIMEVLKRNFLKITGREPVVSGRMGAADTRFLIRVGNTPTAIFGPGVTAQMHAMNENVPVDYLLTATKVLATSILEWCNFDM